MAHRRRRCGFAVVVMACLLGLSGAADVHAQGAPPPQGGTQGGMTAMDDTTAMTAGDTTAMSMGDTTATAMGSQEAPPPAPPPPPEKTGLMGRISNSGLVTLFEAGGNFMWGLLACSLFGVAIVIERFVTLSRAHTNVRKLMADVLSALNKGGIDDATRVCEQTRGPVAAILHAGLTRAHRGMEAVEKAIESAGTIEMSFLERGLIWLNTVTTIAPLLGFLGTVSGMIHAFNAIAEAEQVNAKLVATGISEALITTATGLMIAIPMQAAHNYFVARIDRFVVEMEESTAELVDQMMEMERGIA
jgi:biopolymer transport protein ExbB